MSEGKCLVVGGAGFIGVKIVQKLIEMGYEVTVVDNLSNSDGKLLNKLKCEFIKQDVSDVRVVEMFSKYSLKYIFNFGSPSTDRFFTFDGKGTCETIRGMLNIIEIAKVTGASSIVYPSSGTVYGNLPPPQSEVMKTKPKSMYACTKAFLENISDTVDIKGLNIAGLRIFTGYGEGEIAKSPDSRSVVSLFYDSISRDIPPIVYGNGEQKRDFVYVDDIANIAIKVAESNFRGIVNVGSGTSTSFNHLIELLNSKLGKSVKPRYIPSPIVHISETRADISKLRDEIGYLPVSIEKGIEMYLNRIKIVEKIYQ